MVPPKKMWGNGSSVSFCVPLACSHPPSMVFLFFFKRFFVVVQSLSHVRLFATPWTVARQASLSLTISQSLLKLMFIELVIPFNLLVLCHPLFLLLSIFPIIRVFSNESALLTRWQKYCNFSFSISPSNEYSQLVSFRIGLV